MNLPYASASAGQAREREIRETLRNVGASAVGFMVDDDLDLIIALFRLRGRQITVPVSVAAYEAAWLRENPHSNRMRKTPAEHRAKARLQAEQATWAVLADWIKAQAAMISCGLMDADTAFLPHIQLADGRSVIDAVTAKGSPLALAAPNPERKKE
jgi:hypothetical protein